MGGYAAVEYCGGPSMIFRMGRIDAETESESSGGSSSNKLITYSQEDTSSLFGKW